MRDRIWRLLLALFRATLLDHFSVWNDEIAYQHQIAEELATPVKSRYFLLARKDPGPYGDRARLRQLGMTVVGSLYLNLDSACQ